MYFFASQVLFLCVLAGVECGDLVISDSEPAPPPPPPPAPDSVEKTEDDNDFRTRWLAATKRIGPISNKYCDLSTDAIIAGKSQECFKSEDKEIQACVELAYAEAKTPADRRQMDCDKTAGPLKRVTQKKCIYELRNKRRPSREEIEKRRAKFQAMTPENKEAVITDYKKNVTQRINQMFTKIDQVLTCSEQALGIGR